MRESHSSKDYKKDISKPRELHKEGVVLGNGCEVVVLNLLLRRKKPLQRSNELIDKGCPGTGPVLTFGLRSHMLKTAGDQALSRK